MEDPPASPAPSTPPAGVVSPSREDIVEAARRAADGAGRPISRSDFERLTGISQYHIYRAFPDGGWSQVKRLAGLDRHPKANDAMSDEHLLEAFDSVVRERGEIPTWHQFAASATVSADVVRRRFGGLQGTLIRYRDWLLLHQPDSPYLQALQAPTSRESPPPPAPPDGLSAAGTLALGWTKTSGPEFGPPINFRGLRHAPINEQGVVFLFGMLAYELGFIVEAVHASFPDCEAKRAIDRQRQRWQRVRIEFEYQSRTFRDHGHDPAGCDLIVCWDHNWPDCEVEVLELRTVIESLKS